MDEGEPRGVGIGAWVGRQFSTGTWGRGYGAVAAWRRARSVGTCGRAREEGHVGKGRLERSRGVGHVGKGTWGRVRDAQRA